MSKHTRSKWFVIRSEARNGAEWAKVYVTSNGQLTPDIRGAERHPTFTAASRALSKIFQNWSDTADDTKWRARVVGLRTKATPCA